MVIMQRPKKRMLAITLALLSIGLQSPLASAFPEWLSTVPTHQRAELMSAALAEESGRYQDAFDIYSRLATGGWGSRRAQALFGKARIEMHWSKWRDALTDYDQVFCSFEYKYLSDAEILEAASNMKTIRIQAEAERKKKERKKNERFQFLKPDPVPFG